VVQFSRTPDASPPGDPDDGTNSVLGKARVILEAFDVEDDAVSLSELVRRTGIAKATVHRLAQELLTWGLLERRGSKYGLGLRLFELGQRVPRQRILREAVRPYMEDLFQATKEAVHLAVLDGVEVFYLEKVSGHHQVRRPSRIAGRMPLHCTATGKAILAYSPRGLLDAVVEVGLPRVTRNTMVTPQRLVADLERVRHRGYSVEQEETKLGYLSVAAPLFGGGGSLVAAISVTGPVIRSNVDRLAGVLVPAARTITKRLRETDTGALYPVSGLPFTRVSVS